MEIRFNKGLSITLIIILILTCFSNKVLILWILDLFNPQSYELTTIDLIITSLSLIFANFSKLIIGIWLFLMANKFQQEKWSWLLIGLAFGQYSLIFLATLLIVQSIRIKIDLNKALRPVLILLIFSVFLIPLSKFIETPYFVRVLSVNDFEYMTKYSSYSSLATLGVVILLNIILACKLHKLIGHLQMQGKWLWTISTIFLGLFPIILFNDLIMIKNDK